MRRRGRSPTERFEATNGVVQQGYYSSDDDDDTSILDTDDQEKLIRALDQEARKQYRLFQSAFFAIGAFAMLISLLLLPILCHEECSQQKLSCGIHALVSCALHALSIQLSRTSVVSASETEGQEIDPMLPPLSLMKSPIFAVSVAIDIATLLLWIIGVFHNDVEHFHIGLVLGNLVTLIGALLLCWDAQNTRWALSDLNGAKYEHKSL